MYAFDLKLKKCINFVYTGCGGNGNKFRNKVECDRVCDVQ
ncbi:uncharacterized protein DEA37_0014816 [Paragonimus westermani]|nr:uncharacterized protein DEA37_0009994 [Paragonimus westermani]KAA3673531.1 uncharacterized protein DEA37_0014816 [Paragonimus westermani]